jgi:hypothetical protein
MIIVKKSLIIILASFITLSGCNQQQGSYNNSEGIQKQENLNQSDVDLVENFSNLNELVESSPVVIIAKITNDNEEFTYKEVNFFKTKIKIKDVYRDENKELQKNDEIILLQNDIDDLDPKVIKNEEVLLFIKKYEGPVIKNAYRIVGLVQGHFKLKDGQLISKTDQKSKIYNNTNSISVEEVKDALSITPYDPKKNEIKTIEEIEKQNEKEKELKKQMQSEENK